MSNHHVAVRPQVRLVLSLSPYLPIDKNEDGTGGGITCRLYGADSTPTLLDIEWGESTVIEIIGAALR